ncbi:MAG TPA: sigma-70 family RNA polymerase sigma factor [Polyangiaceae bacterium]|nr:sigma-70 family RNA polymerase sigma factor [Polyangiaceae bacterium]
MERRLLASHSKVDAAISGNLLGHRPGARVSLYAVLEPDDMVARCQRGDGEAFRQLFLRHRAEVARLVFRMVGPRAELEDIIQEVFLQVHRSLKDFRGQSKFTTWLHRVTVNVVLMHRRAAKSRPQLVPPHADEVHVDSRLSPDEDVARLERMRAFRRVIDQLAEKKRTVFLLHELEGLSPAEIANIVGAPVLTVRTRLFYARRELAEMLRHEPTLAAFAQAFERSGSEERVELSKTIGGAR